MERANCLDALDGVSTESAEALIDGGSMRISSIARKSKVFPISQGLGPELVTTRLDYEGRFKLYKVSSKPSLDPNWQEWRNEIDNSNRVTIGGSTWAALLGFSKNESACAAMDRVMRRTEKKEPTWFVKKAMQHGKENEPFVKALVSQQYGVPKRTPSFEPDEMNPDSTLYTLVDTTLNTCLDLCTSPDMVYRTRNTAKDRNDHWTVFEIKCPYYKSDEFENPSNFRDWFHENTKQRNKPFASPSSLTESDARVDYFLQAAFYWWINRGMGASAGGSCDRLSVVEGFFCGDVFCITRYTFNLFDYATRLICELFSSMMASIIEYISENPKRRWTVSRECKQKLYNMCDMLCSTSNANSAKYQKHIDGTISPYLLAMDFEEIQKQSQELEEQRKDDSRD